MAPAIGAALVESVGQHIIVITTGTYLPAVPVLWSVVRGRAWWSRFVVL
jgi:hypothetical protein